jgi:hypothetical protein
MKRGDLVEWATTNSNMRITERAGRIIATIPAYEHPNNILGEAIFSPTQDIRTDESYVVLIPKYGVYMWPSSKALKILTKDRDHLLESQTKPSLHVKAAIDRSDRKKIKALALKLGDEFMESDDFLSIPAWRRRFTFETDRGVEFISKVDYLLETESELA